MARMKIRAMFTTDNGGHCEECRNVHFDPNQVKQAIAHFQEHHNYDCVQVGTETSRGDDGSYVRYTAFYFGET
jgi:hypothetical protein